MYTRLGKCPHPQQDGKPLGAVAQEVQHAIGGAPHHLVGQAAVVGRLPGIAVLPGKGLLQPEELCHRQVPHQVHQHPAQGGIGGEGLVLQGPQPDIQPGGRPKHHRRQGHSQQGVPPIQPQQHQKSPAKVHQKLEHHSHGVAGEHAGGAADVGRGPDYLVRPVGLQSGHRQPHGVAKHLPLHVGRGKVGAGLLPPAAQAHQGHQQHQYSKGWANGAEDLPVACAGLHQFHQLFVEIGDKETHGQRPQSQNTAHQELQSFALHVAEVPGHHPQDAQVIHLVTHSVHLPGFGPSAVAGCPGRAVLSRCPAPPPGRFPCNRPGPCGPPP